MGTQGVRRDLARVQSAYGDRLRRTKAPAAAREHLSAAMDAFEQLRAQPRVTRAANELQATGARRERPHRPEMAARHRNSARSRQRRRPIHRPRDDQSFD